jgi:hypothetical protein
MEGVAGKLNLTKEQAMMFGPETILAMKGVSEGIAGGQFDSTLQAMGIDSQTIEQMKATAQAIEEYTIRDLGDTIQSLFGSLPAMISRLDSWLRNQTS